MSLEREPKATDPVTSIAWGKSLTVSIAPRQIEAVSLARNGTYLKY